MASVNDNLNPQRPSSAGRPSAAPGTTAAGSVSTGKPPVGQPSLALKPRTPTDNALIAVRPQTESDRQQAILQAVRAAQGQPGGAAPETEEKAEEDLSTAKKIADGIGVADGLREGARFASSADEIARLPVIGKAVQGGTRFGRLVSAFTDSRVAKAVSTALAEHRILAPAARFLGRIAPFAGVAVAGYDIYDATKTSKDPKASTTEKTLSATKAALSGIAGVAGVATLVLAPTGIGAAIAGGIALAAGLLSLGADLWLGKVRKDRKADEAQAKA